MKLKIWFAWFGCILLLDQATWLLLLRNACKIGKQNPDLVKDSHASSLQLLSISFPSVRRTSTQLLSLMFWVKLNTETGLESAVSRRSVGPSRFQHWCFFISCTFIVDHTVTRGISLAENIKILIRGHGNRVWLPDGRSRQICRRFLFVFLYVFILHILCGMLDFLFNASILTVYRKILWYEKEPVQRRPWYI